MDILMRPYGHHQMVDTKIRLIISFATQDGALYNQQKQRP